LDLKELRVKWRREREHYRSQELGSGVHSLVRECLECTDLFGLTEGSLATPADRRRGEFIHENKAKDGRQADFVLYVDGDVIVPLEAERLDNIGAGIRQIQQYQLDFDRQYGILTDGETWRFYNNTAWRSFSIEQMLREPAQFRAFWRGYTLPENYYLSFFEPPGQLALLQEREDLPVDTHRARFFEDTTKLISRFSAKLQVEGYFPDMSPAQRSRRAVETTYAYIIQFILYKALVDNGFSGFEGQWTMQDDRVHTFLKARRYRDVLGLIDGISAQVSRNVYRPFAAEQAYINQRLLQLYRSLDNSLSDVSPWLDIFVFVRRYDFTNVQHEVFGYVYENYLKKLYEDSNKGQYFTDPAVVEFMLERVGYTPATLRQRLLNDSNTLSLVDPSCGSGTFLYSAVTALVRAVESQATLSPEELEHVLVENIFGLDIAEFPLYLAEMGILMRILPVIFHSGESHPLGEKLRLFLTKDSIAEFINTPIDNTSVDVSARSGQMQLGLQIQEPEVNSFMRDQDAIRKMKASLVSYGAIPRRRYDFVVGNPPYISYNDCAGQGLLVFTLMKEKRVQLSNIYGVNLHSAPGNRKTYPPKPNLYLFFLALGIALLKDGGRLSYIIPQTLLTESDYDVMRNYLAQHMSIDEIVLFPGAMFVGRGIRQKNTVATSSLILVVTKRPPLADQKVRIVNYTQPEDEIETVFANIRSGHGVNVANLPQQTLLKYYLNWNFLTHSVEFINAYEDYVRATRDISVYYDHRAATLAFESQFYFDVGFILDREKIADERGSGQYEVVEFSQFFGLTQFVPKSYYPSERELIELPKNSQGYVTLDKRFKVLWRNARTDGFYLTDRNVICKMGTASFIASDNEDEMLFLFALLNSSTTEYFLRGWFDLANEKMGYIIAVKRLKEFVRIPADSPQNRLLKKAAIGLAAEWRDQESRKLGDYVESSRILVQSADSVKLRDGNLVISRGNRRISIPVSGPLELVKSTLAAKGLLENGERVSLKELLQTPVVDRQRIAQIRRHLDLIIFAMSFDVRIARGSMNDLQKLESQCAGSPWAPALLRSDERREV